MSHVKPKFSYAQAVNLGGGIQHGEAHQKVFCSYVAEKNDMLRLQKAFVGVVVNPGMTYNIQNAFHSQGYFRVKVTPLGSTLALLEGQEEGEVEALLEDAKEWLEQWFKEIRPWNTQDVDMERTIWLRIFGIPAHAWNNEFFEQITRPWGSYLNADDVTSKKLTMDVARLLIRSSCQKVVDEFFDVKINDEIFHLRALEDSYGPMRIMITQSKEQDGRKINSDDSEADEEEEVRLSTAVEEAGRDSEGEGDNLLALKSIVNANNIALINQDQVEDLHNGREGNKENSNCVLNYVPILYENDLKVEGRGDVDFGGAVKVDGFGVEDAILLGQQEGDGGPAIFMSPQQIVKGGVVRRK
jgi:hypothetical protein